MNKVIGQIIALTKNIFLRNPDGSQNDMEQFCVGKQDPFRSIGSFSISWWYKPLTYKIVENISFIITSEISEFSDCDHKSIQDTVRKTLHEICVDKAIFDGDDVCFARKNTLFDCRKENDTIRFGKYILESIFSNVRLSISACCVIYSAPRITGESFSIDLEKIHIVRKDNQFEWKNLSSLGYCSDEWNPTSGNFRDDTLTAFSKLKYDYLFIVECEGTIDGNKFSASLKLRKLFSVILSILEYKFRHKVMAKPHSICLQLPHNSASKKHLIQTEIGELFPYYANDITVSDADILHIKSWYQIEVSLTEEQKNRVEKCAHFINKGMNSADIDSYIHYFVALDALYGKIGSVSRSIEEGVANLPRCNDWNEKISWLFDLRNELVHGGSRYIEEWPKYMKYYRHFSSDPLRDIEKLSLHALASAPKIFHESNP
ncbi:MAG: hypothetical protein ACJAS1_007044 [Oleiphilaceae bacterium]|jgi:hypothetical protein